jgi:hypothetical protein
MRARKINRLTHNWLRSVISPLHDGERASPYPQVDKRRTHDDL